MFCNVQVKLDMTHMDAFRLSWCNRSYEFMTFGAIHAARQNILPRMFCNVQVKLHITHDACGRISFVLV